MCIRKLSAAVVIAMLAIAAPLAPAAADRHDGIIKVKSDYPVAETVARIKKDIADRGIPFFMEIDQSQLASDAEIALRPSVLLVFGNPPLGTQFITANPLAGLDWPVRLLVTQDENGAVWAAYTDLAWIAQRHHISSRNFQFKLATDVLTSITSSVKAP
jgi:uncharacterized protein (DUF302 family)